MFACINRNIGLEEKTVEEEPEEEKVPTPTKDDTPTKGRGKGKDKDKDQDKKGRKTSARGQRERGGIGRRVSSVIPSPPPGAQTPISEADGRYVSSVCLAAVCLHLFI